MAKGHIRRLGPNSFELRIDLPRDPATGKRRVLSRAFHGGVREAERELTRLKNAINNGEHADPGKMTLGQWLNEWLNTSRSDWARGTFRYYRRTVDHYLVPAFGARRLGKLTPLDIKRAISKWSEDGPRHDGEPGGLSEHAVWRNYSLLKIALTKAVEYDLINRNPCDKVDCTRPTAPEMVTLTPEQSELLLARALNEPPHAGAQRETSLYMPILLALYTGIRRGEVLALRWRNVDLDGGMIRIYEQAEECKGQPTLFKLPKGKKRRVIRLSPFTVAELRRHKLQQAERLFRYGVRQDGDSLVCGKFDGRLYEPGALTATFADFVERFGDHLPVGVTFHTLRHTHATLLLRSGEDIKTVSERLGHASAMTTLQIYVHATKQSHDEAAAKTDTIFRPES